MAQVANPRKQFKFTVIVPGLNPFYCQKCTLPDEEYDSVVHGESGGEVKTAGLAKVGMLRLENMMSADGPDLGLWPWFRLVRLGNPRAYKRTIQVLENGPDGFSILNTHTYDGAWPQKVNGIELAKLSSENTMQTLEFCVDEPDHR